MDPGILGGQRRRVHPTGLGQKRFGFGDSPGSGQQVTQGECDIGNVGAPGGQPRPPDGQGAPQSGFSLGQAPLPDGGQPSNGLRTSLV